MAGGRDARIWKVRSLRRDFEWQGSLVAYWEVHLDPISDDYTPSEISAEELFNRWSDQVRGQFEKDLIPIYWSVLSPGQAKYERMPLQFEHHSARENFLTYYSWPVDSKSGEPLNWLTIPVVDKHWNKKRADKGGFIQETTGWKPSVLQPYVYLKSLMESRSP